MCPPGQAPEGGALISLLKRRAPAVSSGFETAVSFWADSPVRTDLRFPSPDDQRARLTASGCHICHLKTAGAQRATIRARSARRERSNSTRIARRRTEEERAERFP